LKKVIVSVTNDLSSDQRVHRTCTTLVKLGFDVLLIGRKLPSSLPLPARAYKTKRFRLCFKKGPLFYAAFNHRLFRFLLFHKFHLLVANDLDTLLGNYLAKKIKGKQLVYDSHEFFTGVPELEHNKFARNTWLRIERWIFPKLKSVYTVNQSIADLYHDLYGNDVKVVRNMPARKEIVFTKTKKELNLPEDKKIILLQGAWINVDRGAEEVVAAMQFVNDAVLVIVGGGDVIEILKETVNKNQLADRVIFIPKQPFETLFQYTVHADLGLTLDKDTNINYRFSLPNKLFDYLQAGVPVLASPLVEIKAALEKYNAGVFIENHSPEHIAEKINALIHDEPLLKSLKENAKKAALEFCWENEEEKLISIYKAFL
jgi:glycosyltransferase involved in cell wall biosynthesis